LLGCLLIFLLVTTNFSGQHLPRRGDQFPVVEIRLPLKQQLPVDKCRIGAREYAQRISVPYHDVRVFACRE
jgi:hypothetical protein